jgi:hypothetical protein
MKATITFEFDLPEQEAEYYATVRSQEAMFVIYEVDQLLRNQLKHGELAGDRQVMIEVRELLSQIL